MYVKAYFVGNNFFTKKLLIHKVTFTYCDSRHCFILHSHRQTTLPTFSGFWHLWLFSLFLFVGHAISLVNAKGNPFVSQMTTAIILLTPFIHTIGEYSIRHKKHGHRFCETMDFYCKSGWVPIYGFCISIIILSPKMLDFYFF